MVLPVVLLRLLPFAICVDILISVAHSLERAVPYENML